MNSLVSKLLFVKGVVQGVGFRPFVYKIALQNSLKGHVLNTGSGVEIRLEGDEKDFELFCHVLQKNPPPLARIESLDISDQKMQSFETFEIIETKKSDVKQSLISPDIAICQECLEEFFKHKNRREHYYLINCTNCGPRYSIIQTLPYDRDNTSMKRFVMCDECHKEYTNPIDRRYHAQPISCYECGPKLSLYDTNQEEISHSNEAIKKSAQYIKDGKIVAIKGIGGFHIVCDASNEDVVRKLREKKHRPTKPFAVMFKDMQDAKKHLNVSPKEEELLCSKQKPIVLVQKKEKNSFVSIAPHTDNIGAFLPYAPLQFALFEYLDEAIVATSANLRGEPIIKDKEQIFEKLSNVVDFVLDFDREIINANDDSIQAAVANKDIILRASRGYTPTVYHYKAPVRKKILSVGARQKNQVALFLDNNIILSPYIGDIDSIASMEFFERTIKTFEKFYDFEPDVIVCDKHPLYETTQWAKKQNKPLLEIQHHYAHILSTMVEHRLTQKVLGFAWDGTGYGDDGTIWGGETFVCDFHSYERKYHLKPFKLIGGESAIKDINKIALSLLFDNFELQEIEQMDNPAVKSLNTGQIRLLYLAHKKGINAPLTSSIGRLFDAVASLLGFLHSSSYEGEAGLLIESVCDDAITFSYPYVIEEDGMIDLSKMIQEIVREPEVILSANRFINTLVNIICDLASRHPELPVVLSGGVFQNRTLLSRVIQRFESMQKKLYFQQKSPLNDGGICLGQIGYALHSNFLLQ